MFTLAMLAVAMILPVEATLDDHAEERVTAECALVGDVRGTVLNDPALRCPAEVVDASQLQDYASALAEQLPRSTDLAQWQPVTIVESVAFEHRDGGWVLPEPVRLISSEPRYPPRLAERGQIARCDVRVTFAPEQLEQSHDLVCQAFGGRTLRPGRSSRQLVESAEAALENTMWLADPVGGSGCAVTDYRFWIGEDPEDRGEAGPVLDVPLPDAPTCPA